LSTKKDQK